MTKKQKLQLENKAIEILKEWVNQFHQHGSSHDCIKIIFNGHAETDDDGVDDTQFCYAIYIKNDSHLIEKYPEHEEYFELLKQRDDECIIYACLDTTNGRIDLATPDPSDDGLKWTEAVDVIISVADRYK